MKHRSLASSPMFSRIQSVYAAVAVHTAGMCLTAQPRKDPKDTMPMATGLVALKTRGLPESPC